MSVINNIKTEAQIILHFRETFPATMLHTKLLENFVVVFFLPCGKKERTNLKTSSCCHRQHFLSGTTFCESL